MDLRVKDLVGLKFGRLTVVEFSHVYDKVSFWRCVCDCGKEIIKSRYTLKITKYPSCGCWRQENRYRTRKSNRYDICGNVVTGFYKDKKFIFDLEYYGVVNKYYWRISTSGYVYCTREDKYISLHGLIAGKENDMIVDHINRDKLDNRKQNLRIVEKIVNERNRNKSKGNYTSKYIGVYYRKERKKWAANITLNRKKISLGCYENEIDAAIAYNKKAEELGYLTRNIIEE